MVFPLPGDPDTKVTVPFGMPPEIITSKPSIPVFARSILPSISLLSECIRGI
jgi:hypothetical protein